MQVPLMEVLSALEHIRHSLEFGPVQVLQSALHWIREKTELIIPH